MKISFVIHSLGGGGAERVTAHMANYWCNKAFDVSVITVASAKTAQYQLNPKVKLLSLENEVKSCGLLTGAKNNFQRIFKLRKFLKEEGSQVVISMMPTSNIVTCFATMWLPIQHIGSERHYPGRDYTTRLWSILRRHTYRYIDCIVTQTELSERWIADNTTAKRVITIPNPLVLPLVNTSPNVPVIKFGHRHLLIGVGRLTAQKQFSHLIESFSQLSKKHGSWDLVIIGEGELRPDLERLIDSLKLESRIKLVGRVGNVKDWYEESDVFALTSESEGFPNALIEAMAHETACVSYDCLTGPADCIDSGRDGFLVEANNRQQLVKILDRVMSDETLRLKLAANAKNIKSQLSSDKVMSSWENEISFLLT